jgi:hypothetical protein
MTQPEPPEIVVEEGFQALEVDYSDFEILSTEGTDLFVLDLNRRGIVPPYFVVVDGRRFHLQRDTFQTVGHGAQLPEFVREQEAAGRLVLLAERGERYLVYLHDPAAEAAEAAEAEAEAEAAE